MSDEREGIAGSVVDAAGADPPASGRGAAPLPTTATPSSPAPRKRAGRSRTTARRKKKTKKKAAKGPRRNPIAYVINYLREVIAELRKVIWPNRKQMVTYTTVVLVFLAFMVTLIGLVDLGVAKARDDGVRLTWIN